MASDQLTMDYGALEYLVQNLQQMKAAFADDPAGERAIDYQVLNTMGNSLAGSAVHRFLVAWDARRAAALQQLDDLSASMTQMITDFQAVDRRLALEAQPNQPGVQP